MSKILSKPFEIDNNDDLELLFEIIENDKDKELTNEKLIKEFNKRKVKKYEKSI